MEPIDVRASQTGKGKACFEEVRELLIMVREESNQAGDIFLEYLLLALSSLWVSLGLDTHVPSRCCYRGLTK